jgi:uncharacterized Zn-finger protein
LGFKCEEPGCGMAFKFPFLLIAHIRCHKGSEGHVCSWPGCKLRFETPCILQRHMKTHSREGSFRCEICGKDFSSSSSLGRHKKRHGPEASLIGVGSLTVFVIISGAS